MIAAAVMESLIKSIPKEGIPVGNKQDEKNNAM